jgi:microcystin-dependent protein
MTVTSTPLFIKYVGTGAATPFPFTFYVEDPDHVLVQVALPGETSFTTVDPADYSMVLNGGGEGGTITYPLSGGLTSGAVLTIERNVPIEQTVSFANQRRYYAEVLEAALDRIVLQMQQVTEKLGRALVFTRDSVDGEVPEVRAQNGTIVAFMDDVPGVAPIDFDTLNDLDSAVSDATAAAVTATNSALAANSAKAATEAIAIEQNAKLAGITRARGTWVTATAYAVNDTATEGGNLYLCLIAHTSGTFATDLAANRWVIHVAKGAAGAGTGDMLAANNGSEFANKPTVVSNLGFTKTAAQLSALVETLIGQSILWNDNDIPTGFLEENGAAISRTTYAALFAVIGTRFGVGDGSTTFNLPESRGEFIRGWDNSRGVDAGRALGSWQDQMFEDHGHTGITDTQGWHAHTFVGASASTAAGAGGSSYDARPTTLTRATDGAGNHAHNLVVYGANSGTRGSFTRPRNVSKMILIRAY